VCRAFTRRFEGMTARESEPLLRFLFEHASRPHLTARHRWSQGDLVIWDNRCVQHYAIHDHGDAERVLLRVTIEGEEPV
jgi:taurine dioxygenase